MAAISEPESSEVTDARGHVWHRRFNALFQSYLWTRTFRRPGSRIEEQERADWDSLVVLGRMQPRGS